MNRRIYIKCEEDEDVGAMLRIMAGSIANGRIRCDGLEYRENERYLVKNIGEYEILLMQEIGDEADPMAYDIGKASGIFAEIRRRKA